MELVELDKLYGTEQQCREYIAELRWHGQYRCPRCQSDKAWKTKELKYKCQNCGYKASVTAGTIFQDSHIPLPIWFRAMWYIGESAGTMTAVQLQRILGIKNNRTAQSMLRKIKRALIYPKLDKLQGSVEIVVTDIRVQNKKAFVAIAVEVNNRKIGRIRIASIKRNDPETLINFINQCIEQGSSLIHREWILRDFMLCSNYNYAKKLDTYMFSSARKIIYKLEFWLADHYVEGRLSACLNAFCIKVNSLKTKIDFQTVIQNAVYPQH